MLPGDSFFAASSRRRSVAAGLSTGLLEQSSVVPAVGLAGQAYRAGVVRVDPGDLAEVLVAMFAAAAAAVDWAWPGPAVVLLGAVEVDLREAEQFGLVEESRSAVVGRVEIEGWHLGLHACSEAALSHAAVCVGPPGHCWLVPVPVPGPGPEPELVPVPVLELEPGPAAALDVPGPAAVQRAVAAAAGGWGVDHERPAVGDASWH